MNETVVCGECGNEVFEDVAVVVEIGGMDVPVCPSCAGEIDEDEDYDR